MVRFKAETQRIAEYLAKEDGCSIKESSRDVSVFGKNSCARIPADLTDVPTLELLNRNGDPRVVVGYIESGDDPKVWKRGHKLRSIILGRKIERAMKNQGVTIDELANRTGFRPWQIQSIIRGGYRLYSEELYLIVSALGCQLKIVDTEPDVAEKDQETALQD